MPNLNQKGIAHLLVPIILLLGITVTVYIVTLKDPLKLFSKASNLPFTCTACAADVNKDGYVSGPDVSSLIPCLNKQATASGTNKKPCLGKDVNQDGVINLRDIDCIKEQFLKQCKPNPNPTSNPIPTSNPNPTSNPTPKGVKRVFVTSSTYGGNLEGLAGADAKCQARVGATNLGGIWKAWLSSGSTYARNRLIQNQDPYTLVDGTKIANDWTDLTDKNLAVPIDKDEYGNTVSQSGNVWTNTDYAGGAVASTLGYTCNDWTSTDGVSDPGSTQEKTWKWTYGTGYADCTQLKHLYCFEQSPSPSSQSTPSPFSGKWEPYTSADEFRSYIFQSYGFTENAKNFITSNSTIRVSDLQNACGGGGWWSPGPREVFLYCTQNEAAVHELSHSWWHTYRIQNPDIAKSLAKDVVRLADGDGSTAAVAFAKGYVNGIGDWKGMYCNNGCVADTHNIQNSDMSKINDWEIYAGFSSWTMGRFKTGSRALPPYMWKYFEPEFTGTIQVVPYYESGHP